MNIAQQTQSQPEKIGRTKNDGVQEIVGMVDSRWSLFGPGLHSRPVTLASVVRATEVDGKTHICAALLVSGDDQVINEVEKLVAGNKIRVFLGAAPRPYQYWEALPARNLRIHRIAQSYGQRPGAVSQFLPVEAHCVLTNLDWDPAYRTGHRLHVPQ